MPKESITNKQNVGRDKSPNYRMPFIQILHQFHLMSYNNKNVYSTHTPNNKQTVGKSTWSRAPMQSTNERE